MPLFEATLMVTHQVTMNINAEDEEAATNEAVERAEQQYDLVTSIAVEEIPHEERRRRILASFNRR